MHVVILFFTKIPGVSHTGGTYRRPAFFLGAEYSSGAAWTCLPGTRPLPLSTSPNQGLSAPPLGLLQPEVMKTLKVGGATQGGQQPVPGSDLSSTGV